MTVAPAVRKALLTAHITTTVGWLGAVVAFLSLAIVGLTSDDAQTVRTAYLAAEPIMRYALVPLALASLVIGVVQALASRWGLLRHYWVVVKLVLTVFATVVLLQYTQTVTALADLAGQPSGDVAQLRSPTFVLHSAGGLVVLLTATVLSVYKPSGMTRYGQRRRRITPARPPPGRPGGPLVRRSRRP